MTNIHHYQYNNETIGFTTYNEVDGWTFKDRIDFEKWIAVQFLDVCHDHFIVKVRNKFELSDDVTDVDIMKQMKISAY